jgi:predicted RNA-binding protein YlqC (UPF0109 family)
MISQEDHNQNKSGDGASVESLQKLLRGLVEAIVDDDQVVVETVVDAAKVSFIVRINPNGIRKVIGGQGRIVRSLRTILSAAAQRNRCQYSLEIAE